MVTITKLKNTLTEYLKTFQTMSWVTSLSFQLCMWTFKLYYYTIFNSIVMLYCFLNDIWLRTGEEI